MNNQSENIIVDYQKLHDLAIALIRINNKNSFYQFLSEEIQKAIPDSIVLITEICPGESKMKIESFAGLNSENLNKITEIIGINLFDKQFEIKEELIQAIQSKMLVEIKGGFFNNFFSVSQTSGIEKILEIKKTYIIGLVCGNEPLGSINIFTRSIVSIPNREYVESLAGIAAADLERIIASETLHEKEKLLDIIQNSVHIGIMLINADTNLIEYSNNRAVEIYGGKINDLLGKSCKDTICPYDSCPIAELGKELVAVEREIHNIKGELLPVIKSCKKITLRNKVYYLESFFDITKRKIIENELKKSEAKFKQIFENIEDLYYQLDRNGIITLVSPSIYKLSGWSEKDVIGKHVSEIYAFPEKRENLLQVLREKGFVRDYEIILKNKDGSQLNASVSAQIVYNENGEPEGISGLLRDISERKKAEEEIYASREQYMLAVQGSNDGIWDWDIRNNELYLSPKWKEMLGYQDNELENRFETFEGRLHPDDKPFVMNKVQQYFSGEINNYSVEFRLRHRDGHYVWILARGEALRDEEGKAYRMAGSHSDITERKRSEQKLRDSEMNFRTFFNTVEDMIAVAQPDGKIIYSNKHFSEKLGYSFEKLKEMQLLDLHPAEYLDEAKDRYIEIISGISNRCNLPLLTKNEEQIQVETQYWFGKWNGEDCIYAISKDLTRQKAALERFQKLFDSNPAMMALCNLKDRKIIDVNNAFVDKLYYSKDELLGQDFFKTNIISEKAAVDEIIKEFIASKRVINREIQLETKNRTVFQGLLSIESIDSKIEKLILIVLADISVQKKAEYQAQAANRAKSEFLANMSHEIRTPMNSILGFSEILMTEIEEPKYSSYLKAISNSGKTLLTLINDILDLSKIEAGKLELKPELINLRAVLHDIIEIFSFKVQEKKIALSLSIDKSFPDRVALDDIRFRQILLNLVGNAVKFTNEGFVKCELNVDKIDEASIDFSIIISDSGIGIAEDQLDRIFETFSQQSGQDAKLYGGTGLGLAISKRLCELMGAEIRVESQIGIGSAFYVVFKQIAYSKAPFKKESSSVVSQEKYAFGKAKILIADDIKYNRELIISYLAEFGFEFIEAETGKEAIDLALAAQPNLIFMDIRLPDICGINAAKSIKESSSSSNIPIIAFTASVSFGDDTDIYEYFDGILTKPINKSELFEELKRFLNYKRIDNEAYVETENGICDELSLLAPDKRSAVLNEYHTTFASRIDNLLLLMNTEDISLFNEELKEFARRNGLRALEQASYRLELLLNEYEFNEIEELVLEINSNFSDNN